METILLKLTGELFSAKEVLQDVCTQIKTLKQTLNIGIVVGAGNLIRGKTISTHTAGMVATIVNGLFLKDALKQANIESVLFGALHIQQVTTPIKQACIEKALNNNNVLIFTGGTGNPFFSTDTAAVVRALQIGASHLWKGTTVDGIYTDDPKQNPNATMIKQITYDKALQQDLKFMDSTAITLSKQHGLKIRLYNIFEKNALQKAQEDENFGSTVT